MDDDFGGSTAESGGPVGLLQGVSKSYRLDAVAVPVLQRVDLLIRPGLFTVLLGPSGSGKTTLLNLLGCIDRCDEGRVVVAGRDVNDLADDELADFRAQHIGFIFQNFNLLPVLTAYENVEYPMLMAGLPAAKRARRVTRLLEAVGLSDRARNRPGQLSGGQRQRVAIARALGLKPKLVIADEPTANLDSRTGTEILNLMRHMQRRYGMSFVFSSHDRAVIKAADDTIFLRDGAVQAIRRLPSERTPWTRRPATSAVDGNAAAAPHPPVDMWTAEWGTDPHRVFESQVLDGGAKR
jgi:putative ABC transport system ATP-binding protein